MSDQTKTWLGSRLPIAHNITNQLALKPLAANQPYLAALGMLITATLLFLVLSGVVLSAYYVAAEQNAFASIQLIMRTVNDGWMIRSFHATGTTMLFGAVYLAIFRALLTGSYRLPGELVWSLKLVFLLLMLLVGYLGYAMQDSAVSYWSLHSVVRAGAGLSSFPANIFNWVFGGQAGAGTLTRIAVMHGLLTFMALGVLVLHYLAKQAITPLAEKTVPLHPYYTSHHFVAAVVYVLLFAVLAFFAPHLGENPLNQAPANPLLVPAVTTPPWYLLPATAMAQALPGTKGAIAAFVAAFAVLFGMPWLDRSAPGAQPGFLYKLLVIVLGLDVVALCFVTAAGPSTINAVLTIVFIGWYFLHFLVFTPIATARELN